MPKEYKRTDRVAGQMQREIALIIQNELKDPRLGMVTVSGVEVSRDLAHAKVFTTFLSDEPDHGEALKVLALAAGRIRHLLGQRMRLRVVPQLRFIYDSSIQTGARMTALINEAIAADGPPADDSEKVD